jgi:hypothetical protein
MGLLRGVARTAVVAGTATAVSNRVSRRQANRWDQQAQEEEYQSQPAQDQGYADAPAPSPEDQAIEQLQKLAQLRDQGILTPEEFTAKKKQLLGI